MKWPSYVHTSKLHEGKTWQLMMSHTQHLLIYTLKKKNIISCKKSQYIKPLPPKWHKDHTLTFIDFLLRSTRGIILLMQLVRLAGAGAIFTYLVQATKHVPSYWHYCLFFLLFKKIFAIEYMLLHVIFPVFFFLNLIIKQMSLEPRVIVQSIASILICLYSCTSFSINSDHCPVQKMATMSWGPYGRLEEYQILKEEVPYSS